MSTQAHWQQIHAEKLADVSWWQESKALWFDLVERIGLDKAAPVIDVGGGASLFVDELVSRGFTDVTLLDIAQSAIDRVRARLSDAIHYECADITHFVTPKKFALWHDRAVFHFLTSPKDQEAYRQTVKKHTESGSWVILSTFADDGPEKCSGLDVQRYSEEELAAALGHDFQCAWTERRTHVTPWGSEQKFVIAVLKRQ